jgi:hypothetical protein
MDFALMQGFPGLLLLGFAVIGIQKDLCRLVEISRHIGTKPMSVSALAI